MMNLQQKTLLIVIPLITLLSAGYSFYLYTLKSRQINQVIETQEKQLHQQHSHYIKMMINQRYHYELRKLLIQPRVIEAVARQDKKALFEAINPSWQLLHSENPFVKRMHFHRPDGRSLLRVHLPNKFDDKIANRRPMLRKIHTEHKPLSVVEMGSRGLFYRVVEPIFDGDKYIGAVELGFSMEFVMNALRNLLDVEVFLFVGREALPKGDKNLKSSSLQSDYVLWASEPGNLYKLKDFPAILDFNAHTTEKDHGGKTYLLHKEYMPIIEGSHEVIMVFAQNLTPYIKERTFFLWASITISIAVLLIMVITLRLTLTPLLTRLEQTNEKLRNKVDEVTQLSITDTLTQIYNRKHFNVSLVEEISMVDRYGSIFSIIMFDIDYYKGINDSHGHQIGDQVMIEIVSIVSQNIRDSDLFSRWGGDEFMILLPHQTLADGKQIAEKLCHSIRTHLFNDSVRVTISCGVSEFGKEDDEESLLLRVDHNLYQAKKEGRDRAFAN